jgi:hypothetical protein
MRTAAALNSAVPERGSVASIVSRLVSTSSGKWKVMNTRPGRRPGSMRTGASHGAAARRDAHHLAVGDAVSARRRPATVDRLAAAQRRAKLPDCTPVLNESSRRPVVSRSGYCASVAPRPAARRARTWNGAGGPSIGSAHSRPCRNGEPGWPRRGTATGCRPARRGARSSCRRASATARAARPTAPRRTSPRSRPRRATASAMISRSSRAPRGGGTARRTRWTRRSLLVTVPSDSAKLALAGSTTSASSAVG